MDKSWTDILIDELNNPPMSCFKIASTAGVAQSDVSRIKNGKQIPGIDKAERLFTVLGYELRKKGE